MSVSQTFPLLPRFLSSFIIWCMWTVSAKRATEAELPWKTSPLEASYIVSWNVNLLIGVVEDAHTVLRNQRKTSRFASLSRDFFLTKQSGTSSCGGSGSAACLKEFRSFQEHGGMAAVGLRSASVAQTDRAQRQPRKTSGRTFSSSSAPSFSKFFFSIAWTNIKLLDLLANCLGKNAQFHSVSRTE